MATRLSDNFNRADNTSVVGTPQTGPAWTNTRGVWGVIGSEAYCSDNLVGEAACTVQIAGLSNNYIVSADVKGTLNNGTNNQFPRLIIKMIDQTTLIYAYLLSGRVKLRVWDGTTTLWGDVAVAVADNTYCSVKAEYNNHTIKVYVNSTLYITYTLTTTEQTRWGAIDRMGMGNEKNGAPAGNTTRFDNYLITDLVNSVLYTASGSADGLSVVSTSSISPTRIQKASPQADGVSVADAKTTQFTKVSGQVDGLSDAGTIGPNSVFGAGGASVFSISVTNALPSHVDREPITIPGITGVTSTHRLITSSSGSVVAQSAVNGSALIQRPASGTANGLSTVTGGDPKQSLSGLVTANSTVNAQASILNAVAASVGSSSVVAGRATALMSFLVPVQIDGISNTDGTGTVFATVSGLIEGISVAVASFASALKAGGGSDSVFTAQAIPRMIFSGTNLTPVVAPGAASITATPYRITSISATVNAASGTSGNLTVQETIAGLVAIIASASAMPSATYRAAEAPAIAAVSRVQPLTAFTDEMEMTGIFSLYVQLYGIKSIVITL